VQHGPNLNLLGTREPDVYGRTTLADIHAAMETRARAAGVQLESFQSNGEGELINRVQSARDEGVGFIIINPRGLHPHQRGPARRPGGGGHPSSKCTSPTSTPAKPSASTPTSRTWRWA